MKKRAAMLLVGMLTAAFLGGCMQKENPVAPEGSASETSAEEDSTASGDLNETKTLVIADGAYPQTLDIQNQSDVFSSRPAGMIFETLMKINPQGEYVPVLAESWEYEDNTHLVFHLRENVRFHNGDPMTAEDVKWSLIRAINSAHVSSKAAFINPDDITIIDY